MGNPRVKLFCLILFASLSLVVVGCAPPMRASDYSLQDFNRDPMQVSRISMFLSLEAQEASALRMEVARLELLAGDTWLPILGEPKLFDSIDLGTRQIFVGAQNVPPGDYRRLRISVVRAEAMTAGGSYAEVLREPQWFEIDFIGGLSLSADDSKTLLLSWNVDDSLDDKRRFRPAMVARVGVQQIYSDLVFVSCPEIDTIFVVRADNNRVISSFGLSGAPTYVAIEPGSGSRRLFVLCSRDRMIRLIDLETYRVVEFFAVPLSDNPSYMLLPQDLDSLYLVDAQSGYLSRMDPGTGEILARSFLNFQPNYLHYLPQQNLLAVSLALSQQVLLLDPADLKVTSTLSTGNFPAGLVDIDNKLYIAERENDSVRIVDLSRRNELNTLQVGFGPRRLIANQGQIYVGNALDGSLSVLETGGFGVVQTISGIGQPGEMILNNFYSKIYVADEKGKALAVVDTNTNRIISRIELGAMPFGLAGIE